VENQEKMQTLIDDLQRENEEFIKDIKNQGKLNPKNRKHHAA
jgi:hypothetical protein